MNPTNALLPGVILGDHSCIRGAMEGPVRRLHGRERLGEGPPRAVVDARGDPSTRHDFVASTGALAAQPVQQSGAAAAPAPPAAVNLAAPRVDPTPTHSTRRAPTRVQICVFCERPSVSPEYAWPEWLCRFLTDQLIVWSRDHAIDPAVLERTRTEVDQTVRNVCGNCSRGWMQRLEDNVSPFLESMIIGDPTPLSQVRRRLLARWAAKTAVVMEFADDSEVRTPRFASEYLRRIGVHPGTQVLVGKYCGDQQILTHERDVFSRLIDGQKHYFSQSSFVIGKTLIQVFSDPWRNSTPELAESAAQPLISLVPSHDRKSDWPPAIAIDDAGYDIVRHGAVDDDDEPSGQEPAPGE
jgi:hypothetical protein